MCGQAGIIFGRKDREHKELEYLRKLFRYLLLRSEERGPHATGACWIDRDGEHQIFKRPVRACEFIKDNGFTELLSDVNGDTTWLACHTRWQTRGDARNNANNHPVRAGNVIGTHNGTILNADYLFNLFKLTRFAEVDSELLFRLADSMLTRDGRINIRKLKTHLARCRGQMSAVMASKLNPETVVVVKGNKPLELRYHEDLNVIVYASESDYLDGVVTPALGWRSIHVKAMALHTFHCCDLMGFSSVPFQLASPALRGGFERFTIPEYQKADRTMEDA